MEATCLICDRPTNQDLCSLRCAADASREIDRNVRRLQSTHVDTARHAQLVGRNGRLTAALVSAPRAIPTDRDVQVFTTSQDPVSQGQPGSGG